MDDTKLERERGGRPLGYTGDPRIPNPAVVTLNGIVASIAATEVLQILTGFAGPRSPNCGWKKLRPFMENGLRKAKCPP